jgi:hypothetical protein
MDFFDYIQKHAWPFAVGYVAAFAVFGLFFLVFAPKFAQKRVDRASGLGSCAFLEWEFDSRLVIRGVNLVATTRPAQRSGL